MVTVATVADAGRSGAHSRVTEASAGWAEAAPANNTRLATPVATPTRGILSAIDRRFMTGLLPVTIPGRDRASDRRSLTSNGKLGSSRQIRKRCYERALASTRLGPVGL